MRWLILAIEDQMGPHGLRMILQQSGLARFLDSVPAANEELGPTASEYSRLLTAVRTYFGQGARGTLTRIGRSVFRLQVAEQPALSARRLIVGPFLSTQSKLAWILNRLAGEMAIPNGTVRVSRAGDGFWLTDETTDRTLGVSAEQPICWSAVGELEEAVSWMTREEFSVREVDCRATGKEACRFAIL
jgi:predicted hydrocarbon binding protein